MPLKGIQEIWFCRSTWEVVRREELSFNRGFKQIRIDQPAYSYKPSYVILSGTGEVTSDEYGGAKEVKNIYDKMDGSVYRYSP